MWQKTIHFIVLLLVSSFLNFISLLYLNLDLFKVDLIENKKRNSLSFSKFSTIVKNSHLLFIAICAIQSIVGFFMSRQFEVVFGTRRFMVLSFGVITTIFAEVIPNDIVSREWSKNLVLNSFFLNFAYAITLCFSPLKIFIKERKKFFAHRESDLARFINNLSSKEILLLEPNEAKLVNLAFNLDDKDIGSILVPVDKANCLNSAMTLKEIKRIYAEKGLTKYLVFDDQNSKFLGILNIKGLIFSLLNKSAKSWKSHINDEVVFLKKETKLNKALEMLRSSRSHIAVVKEGHKIVGIITLNDILGTLVGKIYDERVV